MRPRLVVVEGVDGSGKTALVEKLVRELPGFNASLHNGAYHGVSTKQLMLNYLKNLNPPPCSHLILDRSWLSERIYAIVKRNGNDRLCDPALSLLDRVAMAMDPVIVHCHPPIEAVLQAFRLRGDSYVTTIIELERLYWLYEERFAKLTAIRFDYTNNTLGDVLHCWPSPAVVRHELPVIGTTKTSPVCLIGNRSGLSCVMNLPFVAPDATGCAWWLAEQLKVVDNSGLVWFDSYGITAVPESVLAIRPRLYVALGDRAARWCERAKIEFSHVEHPGFWKRFKTGKPYPIVELINATQILH